MMKILILLLGVSLGLEEQYINKTFSGYSTDTLIFMIYKKEYTMEIWAKSRKYQPVLSFPICALSGKLGPKEKTGDLQVPEGFYEVKSFLPNSSFKALGINYPNSYDKSLGRTGSGIQIHGNCCSIGCISFENPVMYKIWLIAKKAKKVLVWIFPARQMPSKDHEIFWKMLYKKRDLFLYKGLL